MMNGDPPTMTARLMRDLLKDHGNAQLESAFHWKRQPRHRQRSLSELSISCFLKSKRRLNNIRCDATSSGQTMPSPPKAKSLIVTMSADTLSSPKFISSVRDDLRTLPLTNNDKIDKGLSHSLNQPTTAASSSTETWLNDNGNREAEIAVREYLVQDAESFIPSQKDLLEQRFLIMDQIHSLVCTLGESGRPTDARPSQNLATTRYDGTPRFYEALAQRDFSDLCMHIYGITTEHELWDKITGSKVCLKVFLNAFLAVAATVWIFCERHISVPELLALKTSFPAIESRVKKRQYFAQLL